MYSHSDNVQFLLRTINKGGRLERGYWFYGTDTSLSLSFWNAFDTKSFYPKIRLDISEDKTCRLIIEARGSNNNEKVLLSDIAKGLNVPQKIAERQTKNVPKGEAIDFWIKDYPTDYSYIKVIEDFLQKEKPVIDAILRINDKNNTIPFFTQAKFSADVAKIEKWRATLSGTNVFKSLEDLVNHSLRPIHIYLKNITRFEEIELDLTKRIICIIGKNGSGKSSVLRGYCTWLDRHSAF